jgi:hypothetical protein
MSKESKSKGGKISMAQMSKDSKSKGGKNQNNAAHKSDVWYEAYCDNPNCVALPLDGKVKLGKSRENARSSRHQYNDKNGKSVLCGNYTNDDLDSRLVADLGLNSTQIVCLSQTMFSDSPLAVTKRIQKNKKLMCLGLSSELMQLYASKTPGISAFPEAENLLRFGQNK